MSVITRIINALLAWIPSVTKAWTAGTVASIPFINETFDVMVAAGLPEDFQSIAYGGFALLAAGIVYLVPNAEAGTDQDASA